MKREGFLLFSEYENQVAPTDILKKDDLNPILQGLYGEVGGIMSTAKKLVRDKNAYPGFRHAAEEEFGDTLWYLAAICRRLDIPLQDVFSGAVSCDEFSKVGALSDLSRGGIAYISMPSGEPISLENSLVRLGKSAATMLGTKPLFNELVEFARAYLDAIHAAELAFSEVARLNIKKARGAFLEPKAEDLIGLDFDCGYSEDEQLPKLLKIKISQRRSGKSYLQLNGVFIGDPLTDNIADQDGYRFHDVFHLAYVAILHWSPVIRALIKHKRKSNAKCDEEQDSGRAIVVEEGLTAWIFTKAKELNFFEGQERVPLGILKTISEFVSGYEVEKCPLKLWEKAILEGYEVFRQIKINNGGWVICDRELRTIRYESVGK
ncbi:nucleoside triphosphate pyrophosphohydrolase family protein [Rheinheimera sp. F8]|uniref:nucleoside triphosphate pyrophosphohydrolase family protein n=1 Tax=Rheinheimera sp. F8 TaxID=1763998 RepID=UPI000744A398|nr:nucleoside triphosphate pyrophosphohydrolase family protein [Rheinheimera sp. F8]ALZ77342.1 pyrophosphatase [Rheinheimera sp. F8]